MTTKIAAICWSILFLFQLISATSGAPAPDWSSYLILAFSTAVYSWRIDQGV